MLLTSKKIYLSSFSQKSFNSVEDWTKQLKNQASPDCKVFLIGNKNDLEDL